MGAIASRKREFVSHIAHVLSRRFRKKENNPTKRQSRLKKNRSSRSAALGVVSKSGRVAVEEQKRNFVTLIIKPLDEQLERRYNGRTGGKSSTSTTSPLICLPSLHSRFQPNGEKTKQSVPL